MIFVFRNMICCCSWSENWTLKHTSKGLDQQKMTEIIWGVLFVWHILSANIKGQELCPVLPPATRGWLKCYGICVCSQYLRSTILMDNLISARQEPWKWTPCRSVPQRSNRKPSEQLWRWLVPLQGHICVALVPPVLLRKRIFLRKWNKVCFHDDAHSYPAVVSPRSISLRAHDSLVFSGWVALPDSRISVSVSCPR